LGGAPVVSVNVTLKETTVPATADVGETWALVSELWVVS